MNVELLKNSLLVSAGTTILAGIAGLAVALFTATLERRSRHWIVALAIVSLALPSFVQTNCWLDLLGATGSWRGWCPLKIYSIPGVIWVLTLLTWPIFFGFGLAAWGRIQAAQIESDPALHGIKLLRWLMWPMARASAAQAAVLVFVLALNNFAVPALLQVKVVPAQVWIRFETNLNASAAFSASLPLIVAPLLLLLLWRGREVTWGADTQLSARALRTQVGAPLRVIAALATIGILATSVALPMWQLISARRTWLELGSASVAVSHVTQNSVLFAATAAVACMACGALTWRWRFGWVLWMTFFVPGVLLGIGLIGAFNRGVLDAIYHSAAIIVCAWLIRYVAIGWQTATQAFSSIDRDLIAMARVSGASSWAMFRHVRWPLIAPKLALGWYLVYLLCLWDVETLLLILPPGGETLAVRIFGLLHYGHNTEVNALCLLLLMVALAPLLAWHGVRFARNLVSRVPALLFLALATAGCQQHQSEPQLKSRFFRSVEVIGRRGAGAGEFNKPRCLAVDKQDNLYVADMTGRIQKFSPEGKFLLSWQMPQTDLGKPKGMCIDHEGNLVVVEPHYQRVNHFSLEGKLLRQWGKRGTNVGELMLPRAVAVNSRGDLFLPEYKDVERVQAFSAKDYHAALVFGTPGLGDGQFNRAEGIDIDRQDRIYIADSCNHRVQVFAPDGKWLRSVGRPGKNAGEMSYPWDVRVDREGFEYVCEFGNSRVQIFDAQDRPIEILGRPGSNPGELSTPWGIAFDSRGNLYVCDTGNHRVQKFLRK